MKANLPIWVLDRCFQFQLFFTLITLANMKNIYCTKIHELMPKEELNKIFQVSHPNEVPEYEVVHIHHRRTKRSTNHHQQVALKAFGKTLNLELKENLDLIPKNKDLQLFFAQNDEDKINYIRNNEDEMDVGVIYQDEKNEAALLFYEHDDEKKIVLDGTIGDELVVKPATSTVRKYMEDSELTSEPPYTWANTSIMSNKDTLESTLDDDLPVDYAFLDEDDDTDFSLNSIYHKKYKRATDYSCESCIYTGLHIIYKRKTKEKNRGDYEMMEKISSHTSKVHSRQKRQAPFMIFPEILVIVDYDGYRLHGEDNIAIKRYVISFWNGVDLRYKLLKGPSVKISIAGIIISRGRDATPYLERNRVGRDAIDAASALTDMGKYLFLERRLPVYDIAVAITKLDMCRRKTRHGDCNRGTAGFAYVGGACVVNKRLEKVNSVAIVEDTGGFSGIIVAAHELGHLLGAVHDGSPPPSYLGGPGAVKCRWEDGYIMSDLRHTSKGFKWSYCTVNQFHHFLNGETATCMYNSPHEEESLPRVLPGKLLSLDAQCRKDRGTSACFKDDRVCAQLFCFDAGSGYCVSYRPAAEGSRCGENQMCINGKCVYENENAIEYEDGFLRRSGATLTKSYEDLTALRSKIPHSRSNPLSLRIL